MGGEVFQEATEQIEEDWERGFRLGGLLDGGDGVKPGLRLGATDDLGLMAVESPVHFRDLHATILAALGIKNDNLYWEVSGRQERLTGVAGSGKVIPGLLI